MPNVTNLRFCGQPLGELECYHAMYLITFVAKELNVNACLAHQLYQECLDEFDPNANANLALVFVQKAKEVAKCQQCA